MVLKVWRAWERLTVTGISHSILVFILRSLSRKISSKSKKNKRGKPTERQTDFVMVMMATIVMMMTIMIMMILISEMMVMIMTMTIMMSKLSSPPLFTLFVTDDDDDDDDDGQGRLYCWKRHDWWLYLIVRWIFSYQASLSVLFLGVSQLVLVASGSGGHHRCELHCIQTLTR